MSESAVLAFIKNVGIDHILQERVAKYFVRKRSIKTRKKMD